jgi:hypothetical protein
MQPTTGLTPNDAEQQLPARSHHSQSVRMNATWYAIGAIALARRWATAWRPKVTMWGERRHTTTVRAIGREWGSTYDCLVLNY